MAEFARGAQEIAGGHHGCLPGPHLSDLVER